MLVLTRKLQEAVKIGNDITITVLRLEGGQVRLGIAAPENLRIDREEIWAQRQGKTLRKRKGNR